MSTLPCGCIIDEPDTQAIKHCAEGHTLYGAWQHQDRIMHNSRSWDAYRALGSAARRAQAAYFAHLSSREGAQQA